MGSIARFNLGKIQKDYCAPYFFETGTFRGDGIAYARSFPFKKIFSSEIIPSLAEESRKRFLSDADIFIFEGDSVSVLERSLKEVDDNCIFWLDAHFPGADAGMTPYDEDIVEELRLPLIKEIETIKRLRPHFKDVFIIDDLRIYENGHYENGNAPPDTHPRMDRNIDFIYNNYGSSHDIYKSYLDEGYILVLPHRSYFHHLIRVMGYAPKKFPRQFYAGTYPDK